jgi:WD40-like Beta Propeller Repeat
MKSPRRTTLASSLLTASSSVVFASVFASVLASMSTLGCAGVKGTPTGGSGGSAGMVTPPIPGLVSIEITPGSMSVPLDATGAQLTGSATFTATGHFQDGHTEDVTNRLGWSSQFRSLRVSAGMATVTAPGVYTITAASGSVMATTTLTATFSGNRNADGFDSSCLSVLDGTPAGTASIAYPLDKSIFPPNLSPVTVHVSRTSPQQNCARINFASESVVNVNYYSPCIAGAGSGCYVDLPLEITQLFIAVSESHDIKMTARVGGTGSVPMVESNSVNVSWANVPLSGGLYYWTTMADGVVTGYHPPKNADGTPGLTGTGIQRYDFGKDGVAKPQLVYTDEGKAPLFQGSPPATADGAQCVGCHAITNDGKTMALTVGGSGASDFALLDLTTLTMTVLDPVASGNSTSLTDINYYRQFRRAGVATETTFGPNGDVMVNMYKSQLILHGTTASLANEGQVVPSWAEYKTDPFWSQSGKFFAFTSFSQPDIGTYNTMGTNGDMKRSGQIVIASAGNTMVNDDARVLVARENNVTKYYPAISNDDKLVVYNQSTCGFDPDVYTSGTTVGVYGSQTCDGYDDSSASLWLTTPDGKRPQRLDVANGGATNDNSWPRWSPDNGTYRGLKLYWLAFSSRRPYGLQINGGPPLSTKPQLWFAAILVGSEIGGDPSTPPVWLPNQNPTVPGTVINQVPTGNHVPQWVKVAVQIPG